MCRYKKNLASLLLLVLLLATGSSWAAGKSYIADDPSGESFIQLYDEGKAVKQVIEMLIEPKISDFQTATKTKETFNDDGKVRI